MDDRFFKYINLIHLNFKEYSNQVRIHLIPFKKLYFSFGMRQNTNIDKASVQNIHVFF